MAVFYLEKKKARWSLVCFIAALMAFFFGVAFPFLLPHISATAFLAWIRMPLEQNFPLKDAVKNITYAFGYVLFLWSIRLKNRFKLTLWTFSAVLLVLAILAAKPGSGVHLLLPLLPLAETYVQLSEDDRRRYSLRIAAFLLSLSLNGLNRQKIEAHYLSETPMRWREFSRPERAH